MKLTVLADNNTFIDRYYCGEPAVCYFIEDGGQRILFDTGYSGLFLKNARKLGLDLNTVATVVFSHGHNDHTGGFPHLLKIYRGNGLAVLAHPDAFEEKTESGEPIGSPLSAEQIREKCRLELSAKPVKLTERLTFLGEVPSSNEFEKRPPIGKRRLDGRLEDDYVLDDTALVYQSREGLCLITGCSHSGICNIIEYAKSVCKDSRIRGVIGGYICLKTTSGLRRQLRILSKTALLNYIPAIVFPLLPKRASIRPSLFGRWASGWNLPGDI